MFSTAPAAHFNESSASEVQQQQQQISSNASPSHPSPLASPTPGTTNSNTSSPASTFSPRSSDQLKDDSHLEKFSIQASSIKAKQATGERTSSALDSIAGMASVSSATLLGKAAGHKRKSSSNHSRSSSQLHGDSEPSSRQASSSPYIKNASGAGLNDSGDLSSSSKAGSAAMQGTKRIKTARACDSCRRKKIRCDVIEDDGPILGDPNNGNGGLTCAHCRQYGFQCTFFLPITETRFKKKREREAEEMAAAAAAAGAANRNAFMAGVPNGIRPPLLHPSRSMPMGIIPFNTTHDGHSPMPVNVPRTASLNLTGLPSSTSSNARAALEMQPVRISSTQEWPRKGGRGTSDSPASIHNVRRDVSSSSLLATETTAKHTPLSAHEDDVPPPPDTRVLGPTSIAYIVHSTAFVPGAAIEEHDLKHHQTFEVGASGDGIIKFHKPPKGQASTPEDAEDLADEFVRMPELVRGRLAGDVAEKLVNTYFERVGYLFPVITKSEFLHMSPPPPLILYAICGISALSRDVPKEVLSAVKVTLNSLFRDLDILSNSNMNTVKALLIMSLHSDVHASNAAQAGSRCWNRVGAAIRMSQDLGLHRDASGRDDVDDDAYFLEQKRRVWGCCVTADRCMSISLGHPLTIDLTDCDVRLPSPHEILRYPTDLPAMPGVEKPFAFNAEMLKLSILFGRVMKTIYSPTGLMKTTDEEIVGLQNDIDRWKENLPEALQFKGARDTPAPAGILHVSYSCLLHLFFRVFMRISYNCPQHLTFSLTIERMTMLIKHSRESIDWVDEHDYHMDILQFVSYGLVFCATVQYHAAIRRGDQEAMASLKKARDCVNRFKRQGETDFNKDLSVRAKTAEVITLLHECALGRYNSVPNSGNLNPTAGVTNRRWVETVRGIVFQPDQTRPGGGVYVAKTHNLMLDDLPQGTMILQETDQGAVPALVRTNQESNGGWRLLGQGMSEPGTATVTPSELTHVAGNVWADAEGRPVDRQGSRLLTMVPVQGNDALIQSYPGGPRLSFSAITGQSAGGVQEPIDPAYFSALAAQAAQAAANSANQRSAADESNTSSVPTFNLSDLYTFDGQIARNIAEGGQGQSNAQMQAQSALQLYAFGQNNSNNNNNFSVSSQQTAAGIDPLALDGMPGGALDFAAWEQWFRGAISLNIDGNSG